MPKTESSASLLRGVRTGTCPRETCRQQLLFRCTVRNVRCRSCSESLSIDQIINVTVPNDPELAIRSRASYLEGLGHLGAGRARTASAMADGINSFEHSLLLLDWFERYGFKDGQVKKLSDLGRQDPINVVTLSDYAFGIRREHLNILGYGRNMATAETIETINKLNRDPRRPQRKDTQKRILDEGDILVPLYQDEKKWFWNSAAVISQACVGRVVFMRALFCRALKHLLNRPNEYYVRSKCNVDEWKRVTGQAKDPPDASHPSTVVDLAALANVLRRPIPLLDPRRPFTVETFIPFLYPADKAVDRNGDKRSPLVLAWADESHSHKVAMVAIAGKDDINVVRLPREWFTSIWGIPTASVDGLLSRYLNFDNCGYCVVAHGKYFKPEFLRDIVEAFDQENLRVYGVGPSLIGHVAADIGTRWGDPEEVTKKSLSEWRLWRCMRCECSTRTKDEDVPCCSICKEKSRNCMRQLKKDGTVEYRYGDHTTTLAPRSWCFTKRKHFYDSIEHDNPPLMISFETTVSVAAGSDQSPSTSQLFPQFKRNTHPKPVTEQKLSHSKECLGILEFDQLFDDITPSKEVAFVVGPKCQDKMNDDVRSIIAGGEAIYSDYITMQSESAQAMGGEGLDTLRAVWETDTKLDEMERAIFATLDETLQHVDEETKWRCFESNESFFKPNGFFFHFADRHFRNRKRFQLPLFGERNFKFSRQDDSVVVCDDFGRSMGSSSVNDSNAVSDESLWNQ